MKVFLPAITGLVPDAMVRAIAAFLEICYLVRRSQIHEDALDEIDAAVKRFQVERQVFVDYGIRDDFNLPRQHSLQHYRYLVQLFGAPNGVCSSITESRHITAVKDAWRRTNKNEPLGQILLINQRMDKLEAATDHLQPLIPLHLRDRRDSRRSLQTTRAPPASASLEGDADYDASDVAAVGLLTSEGDVKLPTEPGALLIVHFACMQPTERVCGLSARGYPRPLPQLALRLDISNLHELMRRFLFDQLNPDSPEEGMTTNLENCPAVSPYTHVNVYLHANCIFHAPSDQSGIGGMQREIIRASPSWRSGHPRHDCVFVESEPDKQGFAGLSVAQVTCFLSFKYGGRVYECALVNWFDHFGADVCGVTGMWRVAPQYDYRRRRLTSLIHIDAIYRSAHLIPVFGSAGRVPQDLHHSESLLAYRLFYVNKYIDYHAHQTVF